MAKCDFNVSVLCVNVCQCCYRNQNKYRSFKSNITPYNAEIFKVILPLITLKYSNITPYNAEIFKVILPLITLKYSNITPYNAEIFKVILPFITLKYLK